MKHLVLFAALCFAAPAFAADSAPAAVAAAAHAPEVKAPTPIFVAPPLTVTAPAAPTVITVVDEPAQIPDPSDFASFCEAVFVALKGKQWGMIVALALMALVWLARKYGSEAWPFLATDRGGAMLSLFGALALAIGGAAAAPGIHSLGAVLLTALMAAITASGTYALLKKLLFPSGADLAQGVAVAAAVTGAAVASQASTSPQAASDALNKVGK